MQMSFLFDPSRCVNCYACEIACKQENSLAPQIYCQPGSTGPRWRKVMTLEEGHFPDTKIAYLSLSCMHCGDPDCIKACPAKAISKRPADGIVEINPTKCIGCRFCSWACKFGAPQFGLDGHMQKCQMCQSLLEKGEQPACVTTCTTGAIQYGNVDEISTKMRGKAAMLLAGASEPQFYLLTRGE